jgi:uncharacterized membrane protein
MPSPALFAASLLADADAGRLVPVFEDFAKALTLYLARGVEVCAAVVIGLAAIRATWKALALFYTGPTPQFDAQKIRLQLGRWLALALEFELAADILRTAVAPTWNEIGQLAAIVVLRTALNYFLQLEIDKAAARGKGDPG